jgi:hypothetical protein
MPTPPPPSLAPTQLQKVRLSDVPKLLKKLTGEQRSRKTVYNWAKKGRKNYSNEQVVLETTSVAGTKYTTRSWLLQFLEDVER